MKPHMRRSSKSVVISAVLVVLASALLVGASQVASGDGLNYVPNEYIIHVRPGTSVSTVEQAVNAIGFSFYLPGSDTNGPYTAGTGSWAPNGNWEDADRVVAGDYSMHELTVNAGSILPQ